MTVEGSDSVQRDAHGSAEFGHVPVLSKEAIDFLAVQRGGTYIDATVGLGGHSVLIAKRLGPQGRLTGFDKDARALEIARSRVASPPAERQGDWPEVKLIHASFASVAAHLEPHSADGLIADVGVSSMQFEDASRGFSFQADGPLDMRMDTTQELTAEQVVNQFDERELADLIYEFGEERSSRRIARAVVRARPIKTTSQLARIVASAVARPTNPRLHPATLTFQALRIFVNRELDDLGALLSAEGARKVLKKGGRLVVISFHSLEDRLVKDALREGARRGTWEVLTKKPVVPGEDEVERNPRSRSARMRAAVKLR